ncbi:TPA: hypothetical protein ACV5BL_000524 [Enterobacter hormaechei subsp. steigerwaltii]|uniref:hypothetical protein n=1 Tax=Enterobacter hormaechei TaxID=158836 RepID=UPI0030766C14
MEWTNEQLIETARVVAKYESEKAAQLLNELATRLDCALAATRVACDQRNALAAENAGLKAACERVSMWNDFPQATLRSTGEVVPYVVAYGSNGERDYMRNIAATAVLKYTSETDAFLAELRAAAVDEVCLKISNAIVNCYQDEQVGLDAAATICGDFAAQLRKGVQS